MKKSTFINLLLGVIGGMLFAIGMCLCLLPEWNAFNQGVAVTAAGFLSLLALAVVNWLKAGRPVRKINWKLLGKILYGIVSVLIMGVGMSLIMAGEMLIPGIITGIAGIIMLLFLIPVCIGLKQ